MNKVLIACEESQAVTIEFRKLGIEAYSCDIIECSGSHPEWHIQQDILQVLNQDWSMIIAFPPCTHLSAAGAHLWKQKRKDGRQQKAFEFILKIWDSNDLICIENPQGWLNTNWQKPTQYIEPYMFGDPYKKRTCLWLKNLPKLMPTNIVEPTSYWINSSSNYKDGIKLSNKGKYRNPKDRSKTFPGIAKAMAEQWSKTLSV